MRSGYIASWMLVVVMLAILIAGSPANGQADVVKNHQKRLDRLKTNPDNVNQVSDSVTNLAQKIARAIASPKSKTEIFSPVSIAGALSLLLLGAGGKTQQELMRVMGFNDGRLTFQEIHYAFGRLFQDLVANDPSLVPLVTWRVNDKCNRYDDDYEDEDSPPANTSNTFPSHLISVVNGMFLQKGLKPANRLLSVIREIYQSTVDNLDFVGGPSMAAAYINDWCARETKGKIREMVTAQMVANSRMIVASALYFKAQWETTFSPYGTRPRPFYLNGKQQPPIDVETMAATGCFPYFDATAQYGAQIIGLPYETGKSTMYIVVPGDSNRQKLQQLQAVLGADQLNWMIEQMKTKKGMVLLPKLSISNRIQLSNVLQQLGVQDLFDPSRSNLSQVLDETGPQIVPQQNTALPQASQKPVVTSVGSRFGPSESPAVPSIPVKPAVRPDTVKPTPPAILPVSAYQQPAAQPKPQQSLTPAGPQTFRQPVVLQTNNIQQPTEFPLSASECYQVENCQYVTQTKRCFCTLQASTADVVNCGMHVATYESEPSDRNCPLSFDNGRGRRFVCTKRSYRIEMQLSNQQAACEQRGCLFFSTQCYCCQRNKQSPTYTQTAQTAQLPGVPYVGDNEPGWIYLVRYSSYRPEAGQLHNCQIVLSLNSEQQCVYHRYTWLPSGSTCINDATCVPVHRRTKRQLQFPTQESQNYQQAEYLDQQRQQEAQRAAQQLQQIQAQNRAQQLIQPQQPTRQQQSTILQSQQQSSPLTQRQSDRSLFVNEIITQVKLDVNEQGTEGGAVTLALIDRIGPGYTFQVDCPFLILIRHDNTKALLFYGAVYDPRP